MFHILRTVRVAHRVQSKLFFHTNFNGGYKKVFGGTLKPVKISHNIGTYGKVACVRIHTTRRLDIPPALAILIRPIVNVAAFLFGRYFKKWWARQTPEQKKMYIKWFASKRGVFLGIFGAFLSSIGIFYVLHLEKDPLTQRLRFILLNNKQQAALAKFGYELHLEENRGNLLPSSHPDFIRVARVTNKLLNANKDLPFVRDETWTLNVVNADIKNAYVLPGGHIFVFVGILNLVENDDQLAIVLSHEMAHVLLKHGIEQLSYGAIFDLLLIVPLTLLWALFPDVVALVLQVLGKTFLAVLLRLPYTRMLEKEADDIGLDLAAKACVDVREAVVFWRTMKALETSGENIQPIPWLSTHPESEERENFLNTRMASALKLRMDSGCWGVSRDDPRLRPPRSRNDLHNFLKRLGLI